MLFQRETIFNQVQSVFQARDKALGKVLFSKHDWVRTKIAFDILEEAEAVVDIGIGQGQLVNLLSEIPRMRRVYGVDFRRHSKLIEPKNKTVFEFRQWDITDAANFKISPVDVVVAMEVLEHIDVDKLADTYRRIKALSRHESILVTVPYQEKEPLFHYNKPYGHKQSFDNKKVETIFGRNILYTDYNRLWYFILSSDLIDGTKKVTLEEFKVLSKNILMYSAKRRDDK